MPVRTWSFALTQVGLFFFCFVSRDASAIFLLLLLFVGCCCSLLCNVHLQIVFSLDFIVRWAITQCFTCKQNGFSRAVCAAARSCAHVVCVWETTKPCQMIWNNIKKSERPPIQAANAKPMCTGWSWWWRIPNENRKKNRQHSAAAYVRILCVYKNKENNYKLWYRYKNAKPKMAGPIFNHHQTSVVSYVAAIFSAAFVRCSLLLLRLSGFFFSCSSLILLPLWKNT